MHNKISYIQNLARSVIPWAHVFQHDHFSRKCSTLSIYHGHFSSKNSRKTPRSSPARASYGVLFVSARPYWSFTIVTLCTLSGYTSPRYIESVEHKIARPWCRICGFLLWVQNLIYFLTWSLLWFMPYRAEIHRGTTRSDCNETPSQWRHNRLDGVSNHQPHHCFFSRWFGRRSQKTSKLRLPGLCAGNSSGPGEFSVQMASNAENASIWWRHHAMSSENQWIILSSNSSYLPSYLYVEINNLASAFCDKNAPMIDTVR